MIKWDIVSEAGWLNPLVTKLVVQEELHSTGYRNYLLTHLTTLPKVPSPKFSTISSEVDVKITKLFEVSECLRSE